MEYKWCELERKLIALYSSAEMTPFIDDWKIWFFSRFRETKLTMKIRYFLWGWCEIGFGSFSHSYFGKKYFKLTHWCKISLEDGAHQLQTGNDACLSWANFIEDISHVGVMVNATDWKIGTSSSNSNRIRYIDLRTNNLGKGMNPPFPIPVNSSIDWVL